MLEFDKGWRVPLVLSRRSGFLVAVSISEVAATDTEMLARKAMLCVCVVSVRQCQIVMMVRL
jgi:hypothetical protein